MKQNRKSGQGMVEYIIIVAVIALAAIAIFGVFGDTIRAKMAGGVKQLDSDSSAADAAVSTKSEAFLKDLK
jgi:Flp pilus assembly pilin Flp